MISADLQHEPEHPDDQPVDERDRRTAAAQAITPSATTTMKILLPAHLLAPGHREAGQARAREEQDRETVVQRDLQPCPRSGTAAASRPRTASRPPPTTTSMLAYSARKYSAQRKPLYSVWKPATSSDSASGRSNGSAVGLGDGRDEVHHEGHDHQAVVGEHEPDVPRLLRLHDAHHAERAGHHDAGNQRQARRATS